MIRSLIKRSVIFSLGGGLSKIFATLIFIYLARELKPELFGQVSLFYTLVILIAVFSDMGLNQWYQKQYAKTPNHQLLLSNVISGRVLTLIISVCVFMIFNIAFSIYSVTQTFIFLLVLITENGLSIFDGYFLVNKKVAKVGYKHAIRLIIIFLLMVGYKNVQSLSQFSVYYMLGSLIALVWYLPLNEINNIQLQLMSGLKTLRSSLKYGVLVLTSFTYARGDSLLVQAFMGSWWLGIYTAAYRYLEALATLPAALAQNLFHISAQSQSFTLKQLNKLTGVMLLTGLTIGIIMFSSASLLSIGLLGPEYSPAINVIRILAVVVVMFFINSPLSTVVQSSDLVSKFLPWGIFNTLLNLVVNLILIPIYGVLGAATAMLLTEITGLGINLYFVKKIYKTENA